MTVKIVSFPNQEYKASCNKCATLFTYEIEDVRTDSDHVDVVDCPTCGKRIVHDYVHDIKAK